MACAAIGQLGQLLGIIGSGRTLPMAGYAPAHVHHLWIPRDLYLRHIPVTALTVQPGSDMRPVREMDKIRNLRHRHPLDFLVVQNIVLKDSELGAGVSLRNLLVTPPALG